MKIMLLSGAYKNAGDFLIVDRSEKLLQKVFPQAEIIKQERNVPLDHDIDFINSCDYIFFAGGPGYSNWFYPDQVPFVKDLSRVKSKLAALGMGWNSRRSDAATRYGYTFTPVMKRLLERIQNDTGVLGCRDWFSVQVLKQNGLTGAKMTGCPAWYNFDCLANTQVPIQDLSQVKRICVSDPAFVFSYRSQALELVEYLKNKFKDAEIKFVFHRGTAADSFTSSETAAQTQQLIEDLKQIGVWIEDISYGVEGLHIYDNCDLHIGYRVHAHIYNMSRRNFSVLLEEDCRGTGMNEALGLPSLPAYSTFANEHSDRICKMMQKILPSRLINLYTIQEVDRLLERFQSTGFIDYHNAYEKMKSTYEQMVKYLEGIIS